MVYHEVLNDWMALVTGDNAGAGAGLTAWRNADAAYVDAETIPVDQLIAWDFKAPKYEVQEVGAMTSSMVKKKVDVARKPGEWKSKHAFQTCQFIWWLMQTAGTPTNEGTPTDYNTHTITISTATVPLWHGIHFEDESSGIEIRDDFMGLLPQDLVINCGQNENWKATQEITIPYANKVAGSDLTKETERPALTTGTLWKNWRDLLIGNSVGKSPTTFQYNSNPVEVEIINLGIKLHRDVHFGKPDSSGLYSSGFMQNFDWAIIMDIIPNGDNLYTINDAKRGSYAGNLAYTADWSAHATNDDIIMAWDKLYLEPFNRKNDYNSHFEGYTITLTPYDDTAALTTTGIDGLDNTHFENP